MKKLVSFCLACIAGLGFAFGQRNMEISLSAGSASVYGLSKDIIEAHYNVLLDKPITTSNFTLFGDIYKYAKSEQWKYGLSLGYENAYFEKDGVKKRSPEYYFLPSVVHYWLNPENDINIYSGVGVGVASVKIFSSWEESTRNIFFAANLTPIGIRYGNKNISGFIEGNIGARGIVMAGISIGL